MNFRKNLVYDLQSARRSSRLIWISSHDHARIETIDPNDAGNSLFKICHGVFNAPIQDRATFTNVILLDAKSFKDDSVFQIASAVYDSLSEDIIGLKKDAFMKALISEGAGMVLSQVGVSQVLEMTGIDIRELSESAFDGMAETVADWLTSASEETVMWSADKVDGLLKEIAGEAFPEIDFNTQRRLSVSREGKKKVGEIVRALGTGENITPQESMKRLVELCAASAFEDIEKGEEQRYAKLLVIQNPEYLDPLSLNFLSHFFSMVKDLDEGKALPFSILLSFDDQEKRDDSAPPKPAEVHLKKLRLFAHRYGLLETPSTDAPKLAVREGVFVGRADELARLQEGSLNAFSKPNGLTASVISAEPGMGKTLLAKKHLTQFFEDPQALSKQKIQYRKGVLRLRVNNAPHIGGSNGITSLAASLEDEYRRLLSELSWSSKLLDKAKAGIEEGLTVQNIFSKAMEAATGGIDLTKIAARFKDMKEGRKNTEDLGDALSLQDNQENPAEEYLQALSAQLSDISKLAQRVGGDEEPQPVFLLLDDLQWLDDQTAQFLMQHVLGRYSVRLLATVREGDLANAVVKAQNTPLSAPYFLMLANLLELKGADELPSDVVALKPALPDAGISLHYTSLTGFNKDMLEQVIQETIGQGQDTATDHGKWMADVILGYLSEGKSERPDVNSLFAVETLNLLADPRFNQRYEAIPHVEWHVGRPYFSAHALDMAQQAFTESLKFVLSAIQEKYKDGVRTETGLSPASHAILEERLDLIREFVREKAGPGADDHAIAFLSFSSLSPDSFQSSIIADLLNALVHAEEPEELGELPRKLKARLGAVDASATTDALCDTFEHTYELIQQISSLSRFYAYRHSLFPLFLEAKLDALVDEIVKGQSEKQATEFRSWLYEVCFKTLQTKNAHKTLINAPSQREEAENILKTQLMLAEKGLNTRPEPWAEEWNTTLIYLGLCYESTGRAQEAIRLFEQARDSLYQLYDEKPTFWTELYTTSLILLAKNHIRFWRNKEAISLVEEARDILKPLYDANPSSWAEMYVGSLMTLASGHSQSGNNHKAVELLKQTTSLLERLYVANPARWVHDYTTSMNDLAVNCVHVGHTQEAIKLEKQALNIIKPFYETAPSIHLRAYIRFLGNLSYFYGQDGRVMEAIAMQEKIVNLIKQSYDSDPALWAEEYILTLNNLAVSYIQVGRTQEAIGLHKQAHEILTPLYDTNPAIWSEFYLKNLSSMAFNLGISGAAQESIEFTEKVIETIGPLYNAYPARWAEDFSSIIQYQATNYMQVGTLQEAVNLLEQALEIRKPLYDANSEYWSEDYSLTLKYLALSYKHVGRTQEAIMHLEHALESLRPLYDTDPQSWSVHYTSVLNTLSQLYAQTGRESDAKGAAALAEKILTVTNDEYGDG